MGKTSVAFRLTAMYAAICTVSVSGVLSMSYAVLRASLDDQLDAGLASEVNEYAALVRSRGAEVLGDVLMHESVSEGTDQVFFRLLGERGSEILATDMSKWGDVTVSPELFDAALGGRTVFETRRIAGHSHPVRVMYGRIAPGTVLQLGESMVSDEQMLERLRGTLLFGMAGVFLVSIGAGYVMARRALSGVHRITQGVRAVASGGWDCRVPVSRRDDEIDTLAASFNEMAGRIQALIRELKNVSDDIAHDLRTPITRLRVAAEAVITGGGSAYDGELAGQVVEECDGLLELINTMLDISQTEAKATQTACGRYDISKAVGEMCELFGPAAEDKGIVLLFSREGELPASVDEGRFRRAVAHILDNAVKYTEGPGKITVECRRCGNDAVVSVADTGVGISEADLDRVFARFHRVDQSRSGGGNGLGLSLSRAIVRSFGGEIAASSTLGVGSVFTIRMPVAR